jgi:fatty acid desaturase
MRPENDYWYIKNKAYDFSKFEHPGGPIAIALGRGRDTTELFYSYHPLSSKAEQMLKKYEVVPTLPLKDGANLLFDWTNESPFYTELKQEVKKVLGNNYKAPLVRWLHLLLMGILTVIFYAYFVQGYWWALFAAPFMWWILAVNSFHDASHFALSRDWRVNALFTYISPWFSSPFTWYHQHVIGHHCYTNIHKEDPDLHHSARLWRYTRRSRWMKHYKWQCYYFIFIWTLITASLAFLIDGLFCVSGYYHGIVKMMKISKTRFAAHLFGRALTLYLVVLWPFFYFDSMLKAYIWAVVPNLIFGLCFSLSSQLSHLTGDNIDQFDKAWHKHQVLCSHTFCPDSLFWFTFTGGLSLQIEHHLFPGVNHWHLRTIQPLVQRICEKHGIQYTRSNTISEAFSKHVALLDELSREDVKTK